MQTLLVTVTRTANSPSESSLHSGSSQKYQFDTTKAGIGAGLTFFRLGTTVTNEVVLLRNIDRKRNIKRTLKNRSAMSMVLKLEKTIDSVLNVEFNLN